MKKFDASVPRKMFWSDKLVNKKKCPLCHSTLENEYQDYIIAIRRGEDITTLGAGNEYGAFCSECPVVVLDRKGFERFIGGIVKESPNLEISGAVSFVVLGIVNMDAVPEDKRHLPLGGDDNPIPLVQFLHEIDTANRSESRHGGKRLSGNQRRRRR